MIIIYIYRGYEIVLEKKLGMYCTQYGKFFSMQEAMNDIDQHFKREVT